MSKSMNAWAEEVYRLAIDKGWWKGAASLEAARDLVPTKLNLIHDEVSEASSEARRDLWDTYWTLTMSVWPLPYIGALENVITHSQLVSMVSSAYEGNEYAMNRLAALRAHLGMQTIADEDEEEPPEEETVAEFVDVLCKKYKPEGFGIELIDGIIRSLDLLRALGFDVEELMRMKHSFNETRPYRHGNRRF